MHVQHVAGRDRGRYRDLLRRALAGLGNADVEFNLTGTGFATFLSTNKGGNTAAGQNKLPFEAASEPVVVSAGDIKNGTLAIPTIRTTVTPPTPTGEEAGCPNDELDGRGRHGRLHQRHAHDRAAAGDAHLHLHGERS